MLETSALEPWAGVLEEVACVTLSDAGSYTKQKSFVKKTKSTVTLSEVVNKPKSFKNPYPNKSETGTVKMCAFVQSTVST